MAKVIHLQSDKNANLLEFAIVHDDALDSEKFILEGDGGNLIPYTLTLKATALAQDSTKDTNRGDCGMACGKINIGDLNIGRSFIVYYVGNRNSDGFSGGFSGGSIVLIKTLLSKLEL
jgi:hypothetical protein